MIIKITKEIANITKLLRNKNKKEYEHDVEFKIQNTLRGT